MTQSTQKKNRAPKSRRYDLAYKEAAFAIWFELGQGTSPPSLTAVQAALNERLGGAPTLRALEYWRVRDKWDDRYAAEATLPNVQAYQVMRLSMAMDTFVAKDELRKQAMLALAASTAIIQTEEVKTSLRTAKIYATLTQKAIDLIKAAAVEDGGVSDKIAVETSLTADQATIAAKSFWEGLSSQLPIIGKVIDHDPDGGTT